jgi:hypothetical protein
MKNLPGVLFILALAGVSFAQGIPLARRPAATLTWLRRLPPFARFFLRVNPHSYGVEDARNWGIAYIVFGCLCISVAIAAGLGFFK